ncbi:ABC transporter substrate-binding protein [Salinicola aestuarinus]|uniref:ABC transporter substrate-binding protein n=1 Tax=Salinicola aestuarinus TaxID=1949082 RepID=UPI001300A48A|nr:ABC transporter substrate-binding protein [Salinicola aestuarinus]
MPRHSLASIAAVARFLVLATLLTFTTHADASATPRIAASNWTVAETLIALGVTPYAVADIPNYNAWVAAPPIPPATLDMGLRNQPNLELLAQKPPDVLISSALFSRDNARLEHLMPVRLIDNFSSDLPYFDATVEMTREIARLSHTEDRAEQLIAETKRTLTRTSEALAEVNRPVYVVQFSDPRHVRVFGEGNMVGTLMARTGLDNAWTGPTNGWGYANVSLDRLAETPNAHIVVIRPFPRSVNAELSSNHIWTHLPAVREGRVSEIDPVWIFGGLRSIERLCHALVGALAPDVTLTDGDAS